MTAGDVDLLLYEHFWGFLWREALMKDLTEIGWLFVAPAVVILSLVGLVPLITVVNYSFFEIFILDARF